MGGARTDRAKGRGVAKSRGQLRYKFGTWNVGT